MPKQSNQPILECWCIFATKLTVYKDRLEVGSFFGLNKTTIPRAKVNTTSYTFLTWETVIRTIGGEDYKVCPWSLAKRKQLYNIVKTW